MQEQTFSAISEQIHRHALQRPAHLALVLDDRTLDYASLDPLMDRVAASLQHDRLVPGDVITGKGRAFCSGNRVLPDRELLLAARAMAEMILGGAPGIVAPTKALIDGSSHLPLEEAFKFEHDFAEQRNLALEPNQIVVGNLGSRGRR